MLPLAFKASSNSANDDNGDLNGNGDFTPLELTCLNGINMSKNAELEYRISLHSLVMVILKEQETAVINTNIQIKNNNIAQIHYKKINDLI